MDNNLTLKIFFPIKESAPEEEKKKARMESDELWRGVQEKFFEGREQVYKEWIDLTSNDPKLQQSFIDKEKEQKVYLDEAVRVVNKVRGQISKLDPDQMKQFTSEVQLLMSSGLKEMFTPSSGEETGPRSPVKSTKTTLIKPINEIGGSRRRSFATERDGKFQRFE